jgi:hypothetical protein
MSEHDEVVERQRNLLNAEEWAKGIRTIHSHKINSMYYDDRPEDTADSAVTDKEFNNGVIQRYKNGKLIHTFGEALKGQALIDSYMRNNK